MRLRNIPGADDAILNSEYCIKNPEEQKGHWQDCFNKVQPLHIALLQRTFTRFAENGAESAS